MMAEKPGALRVPWTWWAPRQGRAVEGLLQRCTEGTRNPANQALGLPSPAQPVLATTGRPALRPPAGTQTWCCSRVHWPCSARPSPSPGGFAGSLWLSREARPGGQWCQGWRQRWGVGLEREELAHVQGLHEPQPRSCPWSWPVTHSLLFILSSCAGSPRASAKELSLVLASDLLPPLHLEPQLGPAGRSERTPRSPEGGPITSSPAC